MSVSFQEWVKNCQHQLELFLEDRLPDPKTTPERLHDAMRYAVLGGGKRVRPLLVFAAGELSGAETVSMLYSPILAVGAAVNEIVVLGTARAGAASAVTAMARARVVVPRVRVSRIVGLLRS